MTGIRELESAWNAQADNFNQWDELGLDEIVAFAQKVERAACMGEVRTARHCKTCKHWEKPESDYGELPGSGRCNAVVEFWNATEWVGGSDTRSLKPEYAAKLAFVKDKHSVCAELKTLSEFGCVQYVWGDEKTFPMTSKPAFYGFDADRLEWFPLAKAECAHVLDGYEFAVHRFRREDGSLGDDWMITELSTGAVVVAGYTSRAKAADDARKLVSGGGEERLRQEIARIKSQPGWYPRQEVAQRGELLKNALGGEERNNP